MDPAQIDTSIMTRTLEAILAVFKGGAGRVQDGGVGLLGTLVAIEMCWGGIMWALSENDEVMRRFFRKLILVGIYTFIVLNWTSVANIILDGFVWAGGQAGGTNVPIDRIRDPSTILDLGTTATLNVWKEIGETSVWSSQLLTTVLIGIVALGVLMLYFLLALQVYMAVLEFYIVAAFGTIFIPWGVNRHTKFVAEKYFGAILAQGTKLMVLAALVTAIMPIVENLKLPQNPQFYEVISLFFGMGTVTFVTWRAPNMAAGMMSGSASLHASEAAESGVSAAGTVATGAATAGVAKMVGGSSGGQDGESSVTSGTSVSSTRSGGSTGGSVASGTTETDGGGPTATGGGSGTTRVDGGSSVDAGDLNVEGGGSAAGGQSIDPDELDGDLEEMVDDSSD